jgi:transketolase
MLQYALLHLSGYDLPLEELQRFRQWGSRTPGHPEVGHTPGVEITTGPLGQGIATAVGMAMAERHLAARFNREGLPLFSHRTWVIASDGDLMEGVSAEAASLAGHLGLGHLIVFWDDNQITIDGATALAWSEDVLARFAAYGWQTLAVESGSDLDALAAAADAASADARPSLIRVRTVIGDPAPSKRGTSAAHGSPLGTAEATATKQAMGWEHPPFYVPNELAAVRDHIRDRGAAASQAWDALREALSRTDHAAAHALDRAIAGELPAAWDGAMPRFTVGSSVATRKASGQVLAAIAPRLDGLVGGSADLAGSNNSYQQGRPDFHDPRGGVPRNVHWGIREHAMAAAVNGMALHGGVIPYAATFLVFSDYMRPALRLAALMRLKVRYLFTHDSIGLGEDGPTHQPIEHLACLRAIPGFTVLRPCDAEETVVCWRLLIKRQGPAALVLTRQELPVLDREQHAAAAGAERGAYILVDSPAPQAVLLASGSEVHIALAAREQLARRSIGVRVVSMPSWELFAEQPVSYRDSVLPADLRVRVAIEAGIRQGWERWVGDHGGYVTLDHFGASAPYEELYERFGMTAAATVSEVERLLSLS